MNAIQTASMNKTPLIITAGNQTREMLLSEPWLTNIGSETVPKPYVKWSYQPVRAEDVPAAFMRAYAMALQPPAGPVFLSIPLDDWTKPALDGVTFTRSVSSRVAPDPERLKEFADKLSNAKNPVLIYGSDIARSNGWDIGIEFAEKLNVPVWAAPGSERASFPETHPLYVGGLPFAKGLLSNKLKGHDVALVIGAPVFRYYPMVEGDYLPEGLSLLHITDNPFEAGAAPVGDSLLSDAKLALEALNGMVKARAKSSDTQIVKLPHRMAPSEPVKTVAKEGRLSPLALFTQLRESTSDNTILVEETPSNLASLHQAWPIEHADSFYTFASGSLGWDLPATIGLALAERDANTNRPIVSVIGDGSFQFTLQGLWTAVKQQLPILYVIAVNEEYGILKSFAEFQNNKNVPGLDIPGIDVAKIAQGYGCNVVQTDDLEIIKQTCQEAFTKNVPTVLVVPIETTIPNLV